MSFFNTKAHHRQRESHFSQNFSGSFLESRRVFVTKPISTKGVTLMDTEGYGKDSSKIENINTLPQFEKYIEKRKQDLKNKVNTHPEIQVKKRNEEKTAKKESAESRTKLEKNVEHEKKLTAIREKAEKFKSKLSVEHLWMLEDIAPGTLRKIFTKNGEGKEIDFAGNSKAESIIGLGDILSVSQTYVKVYNKRTGEFVYGIRGTKSTSHRGVGTPSYINMKTGKYIEILDGYTVENISKDEATDQITYFNKNIKNNLYHKDKVLDGGATPENITINETAKKSLRNTYRTKKEEAIKFVKEAFETNDKEKIKKTLEVMTGEDFRTLISVVGKEKFRKAITAVGLDKESIGKTKVRDALKENIAFEFKGTNSAEKNDIYTMLYAVIQHENRGEDFKQFAISKSFAMGVGQILMGNTYKYKKNPFNVKDNLNVSVQLFKDNYSRARKRGMDHKKALKRAVMEYFAGPNGADNPNTIPNNNNKETPNEYLDAVLKKLELGNAEKNVNWKDYEKKYSSGKYSPVNKGAKPESSIDLTSSSAVGSKIAQLSMEMVEKKDRRNLFGGPEELKRFSCWEWANEVYQRAGINASNRQVLYQGPPYKQIGPQLSQKAIKDSIKVGDWLYIHNGNGIDKRGDHSVIFLGWTDSSKTMMRTASFPGSGSPRFKNYPITETKNIRHITRAKAGGGLDAPLLKTKTSSAPPPTEKSDTSEKKENYTEHPALKGALKKALQSGIPKEKAEKLIANQKVISVEYYGNDGKIQRGEMVVHKKLAEDVKGAFEATLKANKEAGHLKYPIANIAPVNEYHWSDEYSMQANNSSGFNPRKMTGSNKISLHGKGMAIDINPVQNPYIKFYKGKNKPMHTANIIKPKEFVKEFAKLYGKNFERDRNTISTETYNRIRSKMKGSIDENHPITKYLKNRGWTWGGNWNSLTDPQHFQKRIED
jgi:hydrogenase maturation factor